MWNMQPGKPIDPTLMAKQGDTIHVPTIRLDDIILNNATTKTMSTTTTTTTKLSSSTALVRTDPYIYLIKIDTQGYEPSVLQGLSNSLSKHQIQFILMEYWPRGMDLISSSSSNNNNKNHNQSSTACTASLEVLELLIHYGYTIYALPPSTHPRAPTNAKQYLQLKNYHWSSPQLPVISNTTTTTSHLRSFCQWFYHVEELYPSSEYKMGYWADLLVVAPMTGSSSSSSSNNNNNNHNHNIIASLHTDLMKRIVEDQQQIQRTS
jgi:hypothetical protein